MQNTRFKCRQHLTRRDGWHNSVQLRLCLYFYVRECTVVAAQQYSGSSMLLFHSNCTNYGCSVHALIYLISPFLNNCCLYSCGLFRSSLATCLSQMWWFLLFDFVVSMYRTYTLHTAHRTISVVEKENVSQFRFTTCPLNSIRVRTTPCITIAYLTRLNSIICVSSRKIKIISWLSLFRMSLKIS